MSEQPSTNGANGGRFKPGNKGGPGNPHARRVARLRAMILDAVSDADLEAVVGKLVAQAKAGDMAAIRELLTRLLGKPSDAIDPDRLDVDETMIEADTLEAERLKRDRGPSVFDDVLATLGGKA